MIGMDRGVLHMYTLNARTHVCVCVCVIVLSVLVKHVAGSGFILVGCYPGQWVIWVSSCDPVSMLMVVTCYATYSHIIRSSQ